MEPTFHEGDHVLTFNWGKIKTGDVIVFTLESKYYIKRIDKLVGPSTRKLAQGKHYNKDYNYVYVSGDNKRESSKIGPIKKEQVIGKVVLKY